MGNLFLKKTWVFFGGATKNKRNSKFSVLLWFKFWAQGGSCSRQSCLEAWQVEACRTTMPANSEKQHLSIVICGHVDSGKSTTTGRLIFELGGLPERELQKLKEEAERLGKGSFAFAFYMDRQKEERERGVTISCTTKEFYTEKWHYTIIDAPGLVLLSISLTVYMVKPAVFGAFFFVHVFFGSHSSTQEIDSPSFSCLGFLQKTWPFVLENSSFSGRKLCSFFCRKLCIVF